jgi:threonine synthase
MEETAATIRSTLEKSNYLLDPHTATAVHVAASHAGPVPMVVLGTAHPAKFPDAVEKASGVRPALPARLKDLTARKERFDILPADIDAVARYVSEHSRVREGVSV